MSSSLLHLVCKRRHGVVNLLPCLSPMWKLRPCHSSTKLPHLCHCLIQLCQNNIICSPSPSLAIAHMFTNTEVQMLLSLNKQKITFAQRAGQNHLRLTAQDANGGRIDAICFRAYDGPIGPMLENHRGQSFHLAGRLEIDEWGGRRKAKLRLEDAAVAD